MACVLSAWHSILNRKVVSAEFSKKEMQARQMMIIVVGQVLKGANIFNSVQYMKDTPGKKVFTSS